MSRLVILLFSTWIFAAFGGTGLCTEIVVREQIDVVYDHGTRLGTEVDHWFVRQKTSGPVKIDILAYEAKDGPFDRPIFTKDLNQDGELTMIDTYVYLFRDDGSLDEADEIAHNDNSAGTYADGSIRSSDSALFLTLDPGDYLLAIGSYFLSVEDAIAGLNDDAFRGGFFYPLTVTDPLGGDTYGEFVESDHADYQLTFSGDLEILWPGAGRTIFPQAVFGGDWQTILSITNPDSLHAAETAVRVYDYLGRQLKIENMSLSPLETRRFKFTESSSQPISGYLVLEHSRQIAPSVRYEGRDVAAEVVESVGVIPHEHLTSHTEFLIDVIYDDMTDTGIALVPDMVEQIESGEVMAVLYDDSGNRIEETLISTGKHYSKFISEIFPGIEKPFSGYLLIHHGGTYDKVHALALLIEYRSGGWELTSLPLHPQN